jgi:hypothetical protein
MFSAPPADSLLRHDDPSFQQHFFFNMAQAQRKKRIEPDGTGDNLWRKTGGSCNGRWAYSWRIIYRRSLNPKST